MERGLCGAENRVTAVEEEDPLGTLGKHLQSNGKQNTGYKALFHLGQLLQ